MFRGPFLKLLMGIKKKKKKMLYSKEYPAWNSTPLQVDNSSPQGFPVL